MKASGERFIPDAGMGQILELEHMHRYYAVAPLLSGKVVLDAACGTGYGSEIIAKYADQVTGIDIDDEAVAYAEKKHKRENISFLQMSIADMTFAANSFDAVVSFETIEHVPEDVQHVFLKKVSELLKADGVFVVSTPDLDVHLRKTQGTYHNPFHIKEYNRNDFEKLLKQYFPYVSMHTQERMGCSLIDGKNAKIINQIEKFEQGDYIIAVCSAQPVVLPLESAYISELHEGEITMAFYFDLGEGYSEDQKTLVYRSHSAGGDFTTEVELEKFGNIRKLRFDPCKFPAKIKIAAQDENGESLEIKPLNGTFYEEDMVHFMHSDPNFELDFTERELPKKVVLSGKCLKYPQIEVDHYWQTRVVALLSEKEKQAQLLEENNKSAGMLLAEKDRQHETLLAEKEQQYEALLAEKAQQYEALLAEKEQQYEALLAEKEQQHEAALAQKEQEKMMLWSEKESCLQELQDAHGQLLNAHQQIALLEGQYSVIVNSQCWKMTAPVRKALDGVKGTGAGNLTFKGCRYLKNHGMKATIKKTVDYIGKKKDILSIQNAKKVEYVSNFKELVKAFGDNGYQVTCPEILRSYEKSEEKKILLVTHELALTGAPVALYEFTRCLKELGYLPTIISPSDGDLKKDYSANGIPVIVYPKLFVEKDAVSAFADLFDTIVASTIICAPVIESLIGIDIPCLWWIHEAEASYSPENVKAMPQILSSNIHVYTGGEYAKRMLKKYRPKYESGILLYSIPDITDEMMLESDFRLPSQAEGKMLFCLVGSIEHRKGQDILVEAIQKLSPEEIAKAFFVFVGKPFYLSCYEKIQEVLNKYPENVLYIEQLSRPELRNLYKEMHCLICASRDDPMPIVVTEALASSKIVICSENTGSASLIEDNQSGLIYRNNDAGELAACIQKVLRHEVEEADFAEKARLIYETNFSDDVFNEKIKRVMRKLDRRETVSEEEKCSLSMKNLINDFYETGLLEDYIWGEEILNGYDDKESKKVLLISHEFSLTGAPVVLQTLAKELQKQGADVLILSMYDGPLADELKKNDIPFGVNKKLNESDFLKKAAEYFDLIILNTVVAYWAAIKLRFVTTPIVWWIHDSKASYEIGGFESVLPAELPKNLRILCGGEYAKKQLLDYYPHYTDRTGVLLYGVPDYCKSKMPRVEYPLGKKADKYLFAVIGLQDMRKGHDIFAQAIKLLSDEERDRAQFVFIGRHLDAPIAEAVDAVCAMYPEQVKYIQEVNRQELFSVYEQCDCIVCSSKDDPLPVFMTEAMMMSKTIICSEYTGTAAIIEEENCGYLYEKNNPEELAQRMREAMASKETSAEMQARARKAYEKHFSEQAFTNAVKEVLTAAEADSLYHGTVSVVIPTYNAGEAFEDFLKMMRNQAYIKDVEITVVDSGSKDRTVDLCREYGANLIEIPNSEFSHSYARNLGAKHSSGQILVFMTQDALPPNENWLYGMIEPILKGEAVATSCRESCPETTELYYKIASWLHASYQGVDKEDQLNRMIPKETKDSLRKKASLNDISSAIDARVFREFIYRFDYAEDLDMGLRLLKAGYTIKLLSSECVIHGHNRKSDYYLKRGFVEAAALELILGKDENRLRDPRKIARQVVFGAIKLDRAIKDSMNSTVREYVAMEQFFENLLVILNKNLQEPVDTSVGMTQLFNEEDTLMLWTLENLQNWAAESCPEESALYNHVCYYIEMMVRPYLREHGIALLDKETQMAIYNCMEKQFFLVAGSELAAIEKDCELYAVLQELRKGV